LIPFFIITQLKRDPNEKGILMDLENRGSSIKLPRDLLHFPSLKEIRLQYLEEKDQYKLRGLAFKGLQKGDILFPADWGCHFTRRACFYNPERSFKKGNATLIDEPFNKFEEIEGRYRNSDHLCEMDFSKKILLVPGESYKFKGYKEPLILLHPGSLEKGHSAFVQKALADWKVNKDLYKQVSALRLALFKVTSHPLEMENLQIPHCFKREGLLINEKWWQKELQRFLKKLTPMGGVEMHKLQHEFPQILDALVHETLKAGLIICKGDYLLRADRDPRKNLSPFGAALLTKLEDQEEGLSPTKVKPAELEQFRLMERMGLLYLSEDWICSAGFFRSQADLILEFLKQFPGSDMPELKEQISLSRRKLLNILQWMEDAGEIINKDNHRYIV